MRMVSVSQGPPECDLRQSYRAADGPAIRRVAANRMGAHGNPEPEASMSDQFLTIDGVRVPRLLYGTAWKEDATQRLAVLALQQGFRGIDTANQRKHYFEAAVGQAVATSPVPRAEVFLQTKFTFRDGQD